MFCYSTDIRDWRCLLSQLEANALRYVTSGLRATQFSKPSLLQRRISSWSPEPQVLACSYRGMLRASFAALFIAIDLEN